MACCDICGKEGTVTTQTFKEGSGLDPINLCRTCQGKLILSLPKNATPDQIRLAINRLFDRVQDEKKHRGSRRF